jgi:hypothetical protein
MNHIITMIHLVEQKDFENSMEKAFATVSELEEKIRPLHKKLNMSKNPQEKDSLQKLINATEKLLKQAEKNSLKEIVKAYELMVPTLLAKLVPSGTRWSRRCIRRIPGLQWTGHLTKDPARRLGNPSWTASNSTSSQSSPLMPLSCSNTTCSSTSGSPSMLRFEPL